MRFPNRQRLETLALTNRAKFVGAKPFPHIVFDEFFDSTLMDSVLEEFPDLESLDSMHFKNPREIKYQGRGEQFFGSETQSLMRFMNSEIFLNFLTALTGIKEPLFGDPYFDGGGQHQTKRGGLLKIHADFNKHKVSGLDRRLNVLLYLNKDWKPEYGGDLELWERDMSKCGVKISPIFNRLVVFETDDTSYHGLPEPLLCPPSRSRKSLALYYYSNGRAGKASVSENLRLVGTNFVSRPENRSDLKANGFMQDPKRFIKIICPDFLIGFVRRHRR